MIIRWRIELLGGLQLLRDEVALPEATRRATGQLLAYLAYHQSQPQSRESLAALLWPDADTPGGLTSLRVLLTRLRTRLGGDLPLKIERQSLQLDTQHAQVDVAQFEQAVRRSRTPETPELRQAALEEALTLYSGPLTPRLDDSWATAARFRLESALCYVCLQLAPLYEEQGRFDDGILVARRAIAVDELREEAHRALIRILLRQGDHAAAHRHYEGLSELLREKARSAPSPQTRALLLTPAPLHPDTPTVDALPTPLTTFFGREGEQEALLRLLRSGKRLVTITGPGGVGKTRFSLLVARRLGWERALHWAPLADLSPGASLDSALLGVLGGSSEAGVAPLDTLKKLLGTAPTLLILDNLEHLPESDLHALIVPLLKASPNLSILATSRKALHLSFEQVFPLPPLPVPEEKARTAEREQSPSVQLFVDRARLLNPNFSASDSTAIAALCRRLDGLPLAIEMAAARTGVATPSQILERLGSGSKFLVSPGKDVPARHESLHAMLAWSYNLLPEEAREFLCEISIFRGSFSLEWAIDLTGRPNALQLLEMLCDSSLIILDISNEETQNQFRILETIREYAKEKYTTEKWNTIQSRYLLMILESIKNCTPDKINTIYQEIINSLHYCIILNLNIEIGLEIIIELSHFSMNIDYTPIIYYIKYITKIDKPISNSYISGLHRIIESLIIRGYHTRASELLATYHSFLENIEAPEINTSYLFTKSILKMTIDPDNSIEYIINCIKECKKTNNEKYLDVFHVNLSSIYERTGRIQDSEKLTFKLIDSNKNLNKNLTGSIYCQLSNIYLILGNFSESFNCLQKSKNIFIETKSTTRYDFALTHECNYLYFTGKYISCIDLCFILLNHIYISNNYQMISWLFEILGKSLLKTGDYVNSALFIGLSESEIPPVPIYLTRHEKERIQNTREKLPMDDPEILAAWQLGKSMNVHEAVERVLNGEIVLI